MEALLSSLPQTHDRKELLDTAVHLAATLFEADAVMAFLFQNGTLSPVSWIGLQPRALGERPAMPENGTREYVSRFMAPGSCRSFMSAALAAGDRSFGELVVCSAGETKRYKREDHEFLALLARRSAEVLDRMSRPEEAEVSGEWLEAVIANIADAVFVCDPRGKIRLINDAGLEMIGTSRDGQQAMTLTEYLAAANIRFLDGRPVPREQLAITRALNGEVVRGLQEIVRDAREGKDRYIIASAAPIHDGAGRLVGAVEVQSDITRLRELDLLKDQFITIAAHEIKTPVTAIKGFAQSLLRGDPGREAKQRDALETIVQQSDRIDHLVRDFLEISRMRNQRELAVERVDLTSLVRETVERIGRAAVRHRVYLSRADEAWVNAEPERLHEVLMNLLDNAMRYSPQGGDVEVRLVSEGGKATISIRDDGLGIPERRRANLFERFYRAHIGTSADYGGLGVGLYISRETVRRHGGEMWFESEEGKGSTFYFSLPLAPSAQGIGDGR